MIEEDNVIMPPDDVARKAEQANQQQFEQQPCGTTVTGSYDIRSVEHQENKEL